MIIVKAATNAPIYLEILLKIHGVDEMEFDNQSQAINCLQKLKLQDCEIKNCTFIRV